jgi:ferredoxin
MARTITEQNLRILIDILIKEGKRVIAPRQSGAMTLYEPLAAGEQLCLDALPRRSAKEAFFPLCETILTYGRDKDGVRIADIDPKAFPETVLLGARPCDAAAPTILDAVFSWDYDDPFFLERRKKTTIIGLACTTCDDACFCTAVGLSPKDTAGSDLFLSPLTDGEYILDAMTPKGEAFQKQYGSLLTEEADKQPLPAASPAAPPLDLQKIKSWLDNNFESELWQEIADRCAGCGACAFLCPACHCFDIVDEGTEAKGARRKSWDACGFGKFTNHASGHNPRDIQNKRFRNRVMHKFKYYRDKFDLTLCTGCGRCIRQCPVGIDIKAVLDEIQRRQ